jgi:hypothetical protein
MEKFFRVRTHGKKRVFGPSSRIGLVSLVSFLLIFISPLFNANIIILADSFLGDRHLAKGLSCSSCHKEDPPQKSPPNNGCLACHGDQGKLVEKTNRVVPNPHDSPHLDPGTPLVCDECHHIHKSTKISCIACHDEFKFRNI